MGHGDVDEPSDPGGVDVGPTDFLALADLVTADVLDFFEFGAALFESLANNGFEGGFVGLNPATGDAPSPVLDVAD